MADRVKYFLLGVLFLVVAGVIAYDKWNSTGEQEMAQRPETDTWEVSVAPGPDPLTVDRGTKPEAGNKAAPDPNAEREPAQPIGPASPPAPAGKTPEARPEQKPELPPVPAPDKTHVIRKGETLEAIAIKYYGSREGIEWIVRANGLGNANRIFANQKLIIPAKKETVKEGAEGGKGGAAATKADVPSRYRVKEGDGDLYAICRRVYGSKGLGARVNRVMRLNHLYSADVKPGTVLILEGR